MLRKGIEEALLYRIQVTIPHVPVTPKLIHKCNTIPVKIPAGFFVDVNRVFLFTAMNRVFKSPTGVELFSPTVLLVFPHVLAALSLGV